MPTIYLVTGIVGHHEERVEWVVCAYTTRVGAQARREKLTDASRDLWNALDAHREKEPAAGEKWDAYIKSRARIVKQFQRKAKDPRLEVGATYDVSTTKLETQS